MSKQTPGNWESFGAAICVDEIDIARVYQPIGMDVHEFYANVRLIAAAPDLLENLIGCMEALVSHVPDCIEVQCARAAIAKAKGE